MDGTGNSTVDKVRNKTTAARAQGNKIVANYVTVDTEEAVRRSDERGKRSGRVVPHEVIRSIHASVSKVVSVAIEEGLFDEFNLWDNNGEGVPKLVASAKGKKLTVHDSAAWRSFVRKGEQ